MDGWEEIRLALAHLNGKLDTIAVQSAADREVRKDHEHRIRSLESRPVADDHEERLRAVEARRCVTPGQLWAVVAGLLAVILAAYPVLSDYFHAIPTQP